MGFIQVATMAVIIVVIVQNIAVVILWLLVECTNNYKTPEFVSPAMFD